MKLEKHSAILQFVSTSCHLPSGKLTLENHHFSWVNPLFRPFSIAFCTFTRGYLVQTRTGLGHPRPGEATDSSWFSFNQTPVTANGQRPKAVSGRKLRQGTLYTTYSHMLWQLWWVWGYFYGIGFMKVFIIPYLAGGSKHIFIFHNT